jgi:hypothetical protein
MNAIQLDVRRDYAVEVYQSLELMMGDLLTECMRSLKCFTVLVADDPAAAQLYLPMATAREMAWELSPVAADSPSARWTKQVSDDIEFDCFSLLLMIAFSVFFDG